MGTTKIPIIIITVRSCHSLSSLQLQAKPWLHLEAPSMRWVVRDNCYPCSKVLCNPSALEPKDTLNLPLESPTGKTKTKQKLTTYLMFFQRLDLLFLQTMGSVCVGGGDTVGGGGGGGGGGGETKQFTTEVTCNFCATSSVTPRPASFTQSLAATLPVTSRAWRTRQTPTYPNINSAQVIPS